MSFKLHTSTFSFFQVKLGVNFPCNLDYIQVMPISQSGTVSIDNCYFNNILTQTSYHLCMYVCHCTSELTCDHFKVRISNQNEVFASTPQAWKLVKVLGYQLLPQIFQNNKYEVFPGPIRIIEVLPKAPRLKYIIFQRSCDISKTTCNLSSRHVP